MKKSENPNIEELTKTFKERAFNLSDIKLPEGLIKKCVWCLGPLKGQQRRWCGEVCLNSAMAWAYPQKEYGLGILLIRQNFKCNICAFDWGAVVEELYKRPRVPYGAADAKDNWRTVFSYWIVSHLKDYMHVHDQPHRIEVDHIVPIYKGGQALGLDNHQAICYTCHKTKTGKDLSGKRKKNGTDSDPTE